jgi:uncharacterized protein (DUF1501 family)
MTLSRRKFLQGASTGLGFLAAASTLPSWLGRADAATLGGYAGYRATVCVFLLGGNDGNNVIVPLGTGPYAQYLAARPNLGLDSTALRVINPVGQPAGAYGLHPSLEKVQALFEQERAAVVCNVGPLVLPMRKADYTSETVARPDNHLPAADPRRQGHGVGRPHGGQARRRQPG